MKKFSILFATLLFLLSGCNDVQTQVTTDVHITTDSPITTEAPVTTSTPETTPLTTTAETQPPEAVTQPAIEMADEIEKQAIDMFAGGNFDFTHSVKYPRILSEKPGAIALNEKIEALYGPTVKKLRDGKEENELYRIGYNAAYTGKDYCTLMLHFTEFGGWQYSEGGESQRFFYYDGTNDRELTVEEYLESMNVDLEKALEGALWSYDLASAGYTADYDGESELTGAAQYRLPNSDEILSTAEENTLYYQRFTEFADSVALDGAFVQSDTVTLYFRGQMYTQDTFTCVLDRETLEPIRPNYEGTIELTSADVDNIEISFKDGKVISATAPAAYADSRITVKAHKVNIYSTSSFNKATLSVNGGVPGSWSNAGGSEYNFYYDSYGRNGIYIEYDKLESIVFYLDPTDAPPVKTAVTYVRDAYSIYNGGKLDVKQSVTYPRITTGTAAAENFNAKVAADYDPIIKSLEDGYDFKIYNIDYTYTYEDGAASFVVDQEIGRQGTEGGYVRKMYYFDVKNDKELTMDEYAARFDIDMEKAKEGALWSYDLGSAGYASGEPTYSETLGGEAVTPEKNTFYYQKHGDFDQTVTLDGISVDESKVVLYMSGHAYISNIFSVTLNRGDLLPARPNHVVNIDVENAENGEFEITFNVGKINSVSLPEGVSDLKISSSSVVFISSENFITESFKINGERWGQEYSARYDPDSEIFSYYFKPSTFIPAQSLASITIEKR